MRILRDSSRPEDNLTGTERRAFRDLQKNTDLTILLANKGNATVLLNTVDYNHKIGALLQDTAYRRLAKGPTETVECKTSLLLKRSTLAQEVCKWLHLMGTRLLRLYGLPKIHKEGVPLRPTVSIIGAPAYKLFKYLAGLLSPLVGHSCWHELHWVCSQSAPLMSQTGGNYIKTNFLCSFPVHPSAFSGVS